MFSLRARRLALVEQAIVGEKRSARTLHNEKTGEVVWGNCLDQQA